MNAQHCIYQYYLMREICMNRALNSECFCSYKNWTLLCLPLSCLSINMYLSIDLTTFFNTKQQVYWCMHKISYQTLHHTHVHTPFAFGLWIRKLLLFALMSCLFICAILQITNYYLTAPAHKLRWGCDAAEQELPVCCLIFKCIYIVLSMIHNCEFCKVVLL